jgi:hypothetical protein
MQDDLTEEWRRLSEHYAQMYDGELARLAGRYSDLTNVAKEVLRVEMLKRGLGDPTKPQEVQQDSRRLRFDRGVELDGREQRDADGEDGAPAHEYTWKTELCECDTSEQVWQLRETLDRAGIQSWPRGAGYSISSTPSRYLILVAADQLEEARKIAAQPIPQDVIDWLQTEVPPLVIPKCPACGDPDPTLLEDEQANRWSCEECGKEWTELEKLPDEHA